MIATKDKPRIKLADIHKIKASPGTGIMAPLHQYEILLFLDFDGVLHGFRNGKLFENLERFENIIRDYPQVLIVFSTSWRFSQTWEQMIGYFSEDIRNRFVGVTPSVQEKWPPYVKHERYKECIKFMEGKWTKAWVALDDADDLFPKDCANLVLCDGQVGIDDTIETKLRNIFASVCTMKTV